MIVARHKTALPLLIAPRTGSVYVQDKDEVSVRCPSCGFPNIRSFWSMKQNREVQCGNCSVTIQLEGTSRGHRIREVAAARQSLNDVLGRRERIPKDCLPHLKPVTPATPSLEQMEQMLDEWDRDAHRGKAAKTEEGVEVRLLKDSA